jgi:hypothetical protein
MLQMRFTPKTLVPLLGVLLFAAACNNLTDLSSITGDASGTYNLSLVGTAPLPFIISSDGTTTDRVTGGNFVLLPDSTFTETLNFDETVSGQVTTTSFTCAGTYSQNGGRLLFTETATSDANNCGGQYNGSWNGANSLSLGVGNFVFIYIRDTPTV